ncbi:conserved protein of unknown function [Pararobbsia alpina]
MRFFRERPNQRGIAVDVEYGHELSALFGGFERCVGAAGPNALPGLVRGHGRRLLFSEHVVKRSAMTDRPSKKFESHCLEKAKQLDRPEFGKQPALEAAYPRASDATLLCNLLLRLVCNDPGVAKCFSEVKEVHVSPRIR